MVISMIARKGLVERINRFERSARLKDRLHKILIGLDVYPSYLCVKSIPSTTGTTRATRDARSWGQQDLQFKTS